MTILDEIVARKRGDLAAVRKNVPREKLLCHMEDREKRDFAAAIGNRGISCIAETKKASPSAGVLREEYRPVDIALSYEQSGAAAISVLTEEHYFKGSLADLQAVKCAVTVPVLRKDFILNEYQVIESAAWGADAVLLIARILAKHELAKLVGLCYTLQLTPLVEIHDERDIEKFAGSDARVVGINNRNLETMTVDLSRTEQLKQLLPGKPVVVSESGVKNREDLCRLARAGVDAVLIGETLMRSSDPGKALAELTRI